MVEHPFSNDVNLKVAVAEAGLSIEGGTVLIPLDVTTSGGVQRLMVTVMIAPG